MSRCKFILCLIISIASAVLCGQITSHSLSNQKSKTDSAELNQVKYGLLSVDEWKRQITTILAAEINTLDLSEMNERDLREHIVSLLNTLIESMDRTIRKANAGTAKGWFKQSFIDLFISMKDIKQGIPELADAVMHEIRKAKTQEQIQGLLKRRLEQYSSRTFDSQDKSQWDRILLETGSGDIGSAREKLQKEIAVRQKLIASKSVLLILLSALLFALSGSGREPLSRSRCLMLVLSLLLLLIPGVLTPMIDLDARIAQMKFLLMGHPVHFDNQILYFQTKSIVDVFWIMITHRDVPMRFVGILLITFSIIFPLLKTASSLGFHFNYRGLRENATIRYFVLKSGKWSMADVMVVAIFMAYIGFDGVIDNQLDKLRSAAHVTMIITTNGTSLQPGYYLFLTYTLLSLCLSAFLARQGGEGPDRRVSAGLEAPVDPPAASGQGNRPVLEPGEDRGTGTPAPQDGVSPDAAASRSEPR